MAEKLFIFDTHPIQYRSPVFRSLQSRHPHLKVWYFNETFDGDRWWYHEVASIPAQPFALPLRDGFSSDVLHTQRDGFWRSYFKIRDILRREKPSAVALYGYYMPEHWIIRWLTKKAGIPLIFIGETFSAASSRLRRIIRAPLQQSFFSGIDQFIAIGKKTASFYAQLGVASERIIAAKYCTDVSFFELSEADSQETRNDWRARLDIPRDAFVLLFVGRLFDRKRPIDMLTLHRKLNPTQPVYTVIVGNGPLEKELSERTSGERHVVLAGFKNQKEIRDYYHGADLLVVPSEYETWGLVVNEAFAAGTPALVTDTCGVAEDLVLPGETGYVYGVGNTDQAATAVGRLIADPQLHQNMSQEARTKVSREYSVEQFAEAFLAALGKFKT